MAERRYEVTLERNVATPMRDGTVLRADVYRPKADGPFPIILMRLPYDKTGAITGDYAHPSWYARQGYVVVVQDCRGRWASEGEWNPFFNEGRDGYDTIEWAASLPGTVPKVGMYGASYVGLTQIRAAVEAPPHLTCVCPAVTASNYFEGWTYEGGALHLAFTENWSMFLATDTARRAGKPEIERMLNKASGTDSWGWYQYLPLKDFQPHREGGMAPYFFDWVEHSTFDDYWKETAPELRYGNVQAQGLHIAGWYDIFLDGSLKNFAGFGSQGQGAARGGQRLMVGPWYHYPWTPQVGEINFGPSAVGSRVDQTQVRYYNWLLRGEDDGISAEPPVTLFVMGENVWRSENEWPLKRAVNTPYYFHSDGYANSMYGDGTLSTTPPTEESHDVYVYEPRGPTPARGGHSCCIEWIVPQGPFDQRPVEMWREVLCYTSEELTAPLEVTGPVKVKLWAATSAVDTDWVAKLVDVFPDGRAINLTEGIIRARFREGLETPKLLERDQIAEYEINLRATSNVFLPGHRIRVDVASAAFPHWDRNPNTGQKLGEATISDVESAMQTVFHDGGRPSHIILPVVPR